MKILLKNATIINEKSSFHNQKLDLLLENGILARIDSKICLLYTSPSPRDRQKSRMPSSA